jgi:hypothetical protein
LDVVPLDICGIVLGSPYLYDINEFFLEMRTNTISQKMEWNTFLEPTI